MPAISTKRRFAFSTIHLINTRRRRIMAKKRSLVLALVGSLAFVFVGIIPTLVGIVAILKKM